MPVVFRGTLIGHIRNCIQCKEAGRPMNMCNTGWVLFVHNSNRPDQTGTKYISPQDHFENLIREAK